MKLALVGYGPLGRQAEAMLREAQPDAPCDFAYFDDHAHAAATSGAFPFAAYRDDAFRDHRFYVCLGYRHPKLRRQIVAELRALGRAVPPYVHPASYVHPSVHVGHGSWIYAGCTIDRNTRIGEAVWIMNGGTLAHDGAIGDACWIGVAVTLSGNVSIGAETFVASGSTIANDLSVGERVTIGLATAVTKSIADDLSVIGNPMRILDRPLRLV